MKTRNLLSGLLIMLSLSGGCGTDGSMPDDDINPPGDDDTTPPDDGKIRFSAAFADIWSVAIYDEGGALVASPDNTEGVSLPDGNYFVDIRDDGGGFIFTEDGRPLLVIGVSGDAEIMLEPHAVDGVERPLAKLRVGNAPDGLHNGTASPRGRMVWEGVEAMYGSYKSESYSYVSNFTLMSYNTYISDHAEEWKMMGEEYEGRISCRTQQDQSSDWDVPGCHNEYGYMDTPWEYNEQDSTSDGLCTGPCRGGTSLAFANFLGFCSGVFRNADGTFRKYPQSFNVAFDYDRARPDTIQVGDVLLFKETWMLALRVIEDTGYEETKRHKVVLLDSDWLDGGPGFEKVGIHVGIFYGGAEVEMASASIVDCIYKGDCPEAP